MSSSLSSGRSEQEPAADPRAVEPRAVDSRAAEPRAVDSRAAEPPAVDLQTAEPQAVGRAQADSIVGGPGNRILAGVVGIGVVVAVAFLVLRALWLSLH